MLRSSELQRLQSELQQRWQGAAQGDDDDHDACDDEFSSCGQLDPSAEKEGGREREREEEGFHRGGMEKWTLKNKSRI